MQTKFLTPIGRRNSWDGAHLQMNIPASAETAIRWEFDPAWADVVAELRGRKPDDWSQLPGAAVVKAGPHRVVYRLDLPTQSVFVKHYRATDWRSMARSLFRASASRREWYKSVEMARRGVPTIRPVAWGETRQSGITADNYFASEAIAGAESLDVVLRALSPLPSIGERARTRRRIVKQLADLAARAHRAGVWHDDFHTGNVLVSGEKLYLIDVPGVRLYGHPLGWRRSRDGLAMFCSGILGHVTRTERWCFWRAYISARPELTITGSRQAAAEVYRAAHAHARRVLRRRDDRAWATNRDFYCQQLASGTAHAVCDLPADELRRTLSAPARLLAARFDRPIKLSHTSVVVESEITLAGRPTPVALKRCRSKTWWKGLLTHVRGTKARLAWYRGQALLARRINTARPLAILEPRRATFLREGFTITAWIDGATNLHLYGWGLAARDSCERRRRSRQLAVSLGQLIGRLHLWRISHRDLKGCNLLVAERPDDVETYLIDLDGLRLRRWFTQQARWRDLARLAASCQAHPWISRSDRLRFLRAYFRIQEDPAVRHAWKRWWREIEVRAVRVTKRQARRGHVIA